MECRMARRTAMLPSAHAAISRRPTTASTTLMCNCIAFHLTLVTLIQHNMRTHIQACTGLCPDLHQVFWLDNEELAETLDNVYT